MATSVPAPMAMPVSARVRAGASLMPSPTMATLPDSCSLRMTASLPSGRTPAITSSTPACLPMASAVRWLSPVSITTRMPMFCSSWMARGLSSLMVSATAMTPISLPAPPKKRGVLPCAERAAASFCNASGTSTLVAMKLALPPKISMPSSLAERPLPGRAVKSVTSGHAMVSVSA